MSLDMEPLLAALLPDNGEGWRVHQPEQTDTGLWAACTHRQKLKRHLFTKKLSLWQVFRHRYLYLYRLDLLDFNTLARCLDEAMSAAHVKPGWKQRLWDVSIVLVCDAARPDALELVERFGKCHLYKLGLHGRLCARAAALDLATGEVIHGPHGKAPAQQLKACLGM